jgi:hypothetical protein
MWNHIKSKFSVLHAHTNNLVLLDALFFNPDYIKTRSKAHHKLQTTSSKTTGKE